MESNELADTTAMWRCAGSVEPYESWNEMQTLPITGNFHSLEPMPFYWTVSPQEVAYFSQWMAVNVEGSVYAKELVNDWIALTKNGQQSTQYRTAEQFRVAFGACVNSEAQARKIYRPAPPVYPAYEPIVSYDASAMFTPTPFFDGFFQGHDTDLIPAMLRLFVATPLYKGPGRYEIFCTNRRVVTVVVDRAIVNLPAGVSVAASASQPGEGPENVLDTNLSTIWHTPWDLRAALPQSITLDFKADCSMYGLTYVPRQVGLNGMIQDYQVQVSSDGQQFSTVASGTWAVDTAKKDVSFAATRGRYMRLVALSGVGGWASAARISAVVC